MTKTELLFIRACKSNDPYQRVMSVYKRFYLPSGSESVNRDVLIGILGNICDNYLNASVVRIIDDLRPHRFVNDKRSFEERAFHSLISWIRLSPVDVFDDYTPPAKFRNKPE